MSLERDQREMLCPNVVCDKEEVGVCVSKIQIEGFS